MPDQPAAKPWTHRREPGRVVQPRDVVHDLVSETKGVRRLRKDSRPDYVRQHDPSAGADTAARGPKNKLLATIAGDRDSRPRASARKRERSSPSLNATKRLANNSAARSRALMS